MRSAYIVEPSHQLSPRRIRSERRLCKEPAARDGLQSLEGTRLVTRSSLLSHHSCPLTDRLRGIALAEAALTPQNRHPRRRGPPACAATTTGARFHGYDFGAST